MIWINKGDAPPELAKVNEELGKANLKTYRDHRSSTKIKSSSKGKKARKSADTIYITAAYRANAVKAKLVETHWGKCAYCETRLLSVSHGDVEHFRPKSQYTESGSKGMGYFWLAYDWNNLYLACKVCNETYKGTYFALMPAVEELIEPSVRLDPGQTIEDSEEQAVLIDPGYENPRAYVEFDTRTGEMKALEEGDLVVAGARVGKMITALGLNRIDLLTARHRHIASLQSLFLLACEQLVVDPTSVQALFAVCEQIALLKQLRDLNPARECQAQLDELCRRLYTTTSGPFESRSSRDNRKEALRWLFFSVSPRAEYSALAQDCLLAWTRTLNLHNVEVRGTTQAPETLSHMSTVNLNDWPPTVLPSVMDHVQLCELAIKNYLERKQVEVEGMHEALRQRSYDELNDLVASYNKFQTRFDADLAENEYLAWRVELEAINEELVELEGTACAKQRNTLLEFFEQQLEQAALARLPDADRQLQAIWSDFEELRRQVEPLDACWTSALEILRAMNTLVTALWEGIERGSLLPVDDYDLRPAPQMPVDVLEQIAGRVGDLLMPLSPEFNEQVGLARNRYQFWLTAPLSPTQKQAAMDYAGENGFVQAREKLIALNETVEQLPQLLSTLTKAAALRRRCDELVLSYANAGATTDNWRLRTLHSVRNALLAIEDARDNTADSLIDRTLKIISPNPTSESPSHDTQPSTPFALRPQQKLDWSVKTAKKKLADWRNRRANLKQKRKLTKNQKRQYNALREEDRKVRALLAQFDARKVEDMDPEAPR